LSAPAFNYVYLIVEEAYAMITQKPNTKPETLVKNMLIEDRADTLSYIKEKLTLNDLRTATQNLQAVCNIVHQILSKPDPNIVDAYKIANFVATGFHDNVDIFQEIKRESIELHKGHINLPNMVNLDRAYYAEKLKGNKSEYLVKAIANMLEILDLTAHILSRESIHVSKQKHILVANTLLSKALYKPCMDIVSSTDMNIIWNKLVFAAKDTIIGPSDSYITMGETRMFKEHRIEFTNDGIFVDDTDPVAVDTENNGLITCCTLFFTPIDAWLYFHETGHFALRHPEAEPFHFKGRLANKDFSKSLYRELVA